MKENQGKYDYRTLEILISRTYLAYVFCFISLYGSIIDRPQDYGRSMYATRERISVV